jgi:hypothetical protein
MSTIADLITVARAELADENASRFSAATLLLLAKKAITRANNVMMKHGIPLARKQATITGIVGTEAYTLPTDFGSFYGLYRDSNNTKLNHCTDDVWYRLSSPSESTECAVLVDNTGTEKLYIAGPPSTAETLTLSYYPVLDVSAYTTATTVPWGGRLDYVLSDYIKLSAQNIDEMDSSFDSQLMGELETSILESLFNHGPRRRQREGWNT